jgi:BASS family bile acid:Na+ symporter
MPSTICPSLTCYAMTAPIENPIPPNDAQPDPPPSNNELAMQRTEMAEQRTELAGQRTELAKERTGMSTQRTAMAGQRTELAQERTGLAVERTDLAETRTELARERTRAAEERTLMAWIRTALSMISFGFGIDRLFKYLDKTETSIGVNVLTEERILGLSLMSLGLFTLIAAIVNHWRILKNIEAQEYKYTPSWSQGLIIAIILLFLGLAAFIPLVLTGVQMSEVFTLDSQVLQTLAALTIFCLMLTLGVQTPPGNLATLWQNPARLARALLSALVLFPLGAALIGYLLLHGATGIRPIALGLVVLAAAPGAPLLTRRAVMAGGDIAIATSLQVTLATLAVVTTPLTLWLFSVVFARVEASGDFLAIAKQVLTVQFLPLGLGLLIRQLGGEMAAAISELLTTIANTLFLVLLVFLLGISIVLVPTVYWRGLAIIPVIVIFGLVCGHFLGGPDLPGRSAIATGSIARNVGLALFLVTANGAPSAIPTIVTYMVIGSATALPYNIWVKRQMQNPVDPGSTIAV